MTVSTPRKNEPRHSKTGFLGLSWSIPLLLGVMVSVLLGVALTSRSLTPAGFAEGRAVRHHGLTYDIDTPRKNFVQAGQQSMLCVQRLMNSGRVN